MVNGVYEPGEWGSYGNCTTVRANDTGGFAEIYMTLDNDTYTYIGTVYIMGSQYNGYKNDTQDIEINIYDDVTYSYQRCIDTVDGSGYYHCGFWGSAIIISKFGYGAQFTICHIDAFEETNLMLASPSMSSTTNEADFPTSNLLRTHPISYS